jgi:hypothetical protein
MATPLYRRSADELDQLLSRDIDRVDWLLEEEVDLLLNRHRGALLDMARPIPPVGTMSTDGTMSKDNDHELVRFAQCVVAHDSAEKIARSIGFLLPVLDAICDRRQRLRAFKATNVLLEGVHSKAMNSTKSWVEEYRQELHLKRARRSNVRRVQQRRERLRPLLAEMADKLPSEGLAQIAARLRKRKDFGAQFQVSRRTLEEDVAALLTPSETE